MCVEICLLLQWGLMLGDVNRYIVSSGSPIETESIMRLLAAEPLKAYVHGFFAFGDNGIVCDRIDDKVVRS